MRPNDEHLFVHDNQYSVTSAVSRATRQVVERYQYSPYGKTTVLDNEFDPKDEGEPVSYTHLTLPTTPYV